MILIFKNDLHKNEMTSSGLYTRTFSFNPDMYMDEMLSTLEEFDIDDDTYIDEETGEYEFERFYDDNDFNDKIWEGIDNDITTYSNEECMTIITECGYDIYDIIQIIKNDYGNELLEFGDKQHFYWCLAFTAIREKFDFKDTYLQYCKRKYLTDE